MSVPLVSVIMPVYNGERFLAEAIESVLEQTFSEFELLIIDDASTDASAEIAANYVAQDSRVRLHRLTVNTGAVGARNAALRQARCDILANMDADDISLPERLARQAAYLRAHNDVAVVGSGVQVIDELGNRGKIRQYPADPVAAGWSMLFFNSLAHPTVVMRRSALESVGGYALESQGTWAEDYHLFTRLSRKFKIANVPEVLLLYRQWSSSTTSKNWDTQELNASKIVQGIAQELIGRPLDLETARSLRGLAVERYPRTRQEVQQLAEVLPQLVRGYIAVRQLSSVQAKQVRLDAGVKLWLLAALAVRVAPLSAPAIAFRGARLHPRSTFAFLGKVVRRLLRQNSATKFALDS